MDKAKKITVTFNMDKELAEKLNKYAGIKGQTKTVYLTRALQEQIAKDEKEEKGKNGL